MNYIYDVILNFQKNYIDFFEWNKKDNLYHIRKIPIIKISTKQLLEIQNNFITFNKNNPFFQKIQAEKFSKNGITKIKNIFIASDGKEAIAIKLNKDLQIILISSLLPDEQDDVTNILYSKTETSLEYKIIKSKNNNPFKTRFEKENEKFITNELEKTYKEKNFQKIKYLHLECFNKEESNITLAYEKLKKEISKSNENFTKIYNFFKITSKNKNEKQVFHENS